MKERPILFSGLMVRAILDGRKTQTRRIIKPQPSMVHFGDHEALGWEGNICADGWLGVGVSRVKEWANYLKCPYGKPGDRLWVRETWAPMSTFDPSPETGAVYKADNYPSQSVIACKWKPSIHMPRWASRITLEITGVRVERLHDISEADAMAEGVERIDLSPRKINGMQVHPLKSSYFAAFMELWRSINGPESWAANPWVWVVEFRRCEQ